MSSRGARTLRRMLWEATGGVQSGLIQIELKT